MGKTVTLVLFLVVTCSGQVLLPEGTKLRVRLDQTISSANAEEGQVVELSVTDAIKSGDAVIIAEGARVTGTITQAQEKRRLGRAGKLDFSIDRVKTVTNQWIPLRYTVTKKSGESHAVSTGILTAGAAVLFWPAAPVMLLRKGQDITINRGVSFDVYTDTNYNVSTNFAAGGTVPMLQPAAPQSQGPAGTDVAVVALPAAVPSLSQSGGPATISITSSLAAADIEVDGAFVGNTPTTLQLAPGPHRILVKLGAKTWQRTLQVNSGSTISLSATLQ